MDGPNLCVTSPLMLDVKRKKSASGGFGAETGFRICALLLSGFWPASVARIAEHLSLAEPYVRRVLDTLTSRGYLVRGESTNRRTGVRQHVYGVAGFDFQSKVIQRELTFLAPNYRDKVKPKKEGG